MELFGAFTINTVLFLEGMGYCPNGEGGRFVEGRRLAAGGGWRANGRVFRICNLQVPEVAQRFVTPRARQAGICQLRRKPE